MEKYEQREYVIDFMVQSAEFWCAERIIDCLIVTKDRSC